jgi:hypothetical protein
MCLTPAVVIRSGRPCECVEGARVPRCPPQSGRSWKFGCGRVGLATEINMHDVSLPPDDIAVAKAHGRAPTVAAGLDRYRCVTCGAANANQTDADSEPRSLAYRVIATPP